MVRIRRPLRFVRRTDRYRIWCDVDACEDEWASRSPQREFGLSGLRHRGIRRVEIWPGQLRKSDPAAAE